MYLTVRQHLESWEKILYKKIQNAKYVFIIHFIFRPDLKIVYFGL